MQIEINLLVIKLSATFVVVKGKAIPVTGHGGP
jgi:hypothetical protein